MSKSNCAHDTSEGLASILELAGRFFAENPTRQYYAAHVSDDPDGSWSFVVFEGRWPAAQFNFTPPSNQFTREEFQFMLNTLPRGHAILSDWVEREGGGTRTAVVDALTEVLAAATASPTRH